MPSAREGMQKQKSAHKGRIFVSGGEGVRQTTIYGGLFLSADSVYIAYKIAVYVVLNLWRFVSIRPKPLYNVWYTVWFRTIPWHAPATN